MSRFFTPSTPEAFQLLMEGTDLFADMEQHGFRIDTEYLDRAIKTSAETIKWMEDDLKKDDIWKAWKEKFKDKASLGSTDQMGEILFDDLKYPCNNRTKTGKPSMTEEALEEIDIPFCEHYVEMEKLKKARGTFLLGIKEELDDKGWLHPFQNLHLATTYRSSSDSPNLHNQPARDVRQAKLIRTAFIPTSDEYVILERDYSALEYRGAANFWKDAEMIRSASDPKYDVHKDIGAECYDLHRDEVSKSTRSVAKNSFVFPELYGSTYKNCSTNLWHQIARQRLKTVSGVGLYEHLKTKGIHTQKDFTAHIKNVEYKFNGRFPTWSVEKERWWNAYLERGWFPLSTGFVCHGLHSYNNLMNTPVQGPSFHIVLWSLIQINKWLKKYKMKTKLILQIHDAAILDVYRKELEDVLEMTERIMTQEVRKHWPWIITPLAVETEISQTNWFEKKAVKPNEIKEYQVSV